ncbi:MAG: HlyD family type I secretion periplasmic adaptor subunit [Azoarcus sp.]|nr:HlyD family type I secretion periplasmic adaptor subunit [Azoarcus sp.]
MKSTTDAKDEPFDPLYQDFHPPLLRVERTPPAPLGRKILWVLIAMIAFVILWALLGRLDIVAVAQGRLVPESYLKIMQPSEAGIVRDLLVREGDEVQAGQVLMRMDTALSDADTNALAAEYQRKRLSLLRIDAELSDTEPDLSDAQPPTIALEIEAQFRANRAALAAALAEERNRLAEARQQQAAAEQTLRKLDETLPHYRKQEQAFERLTREGFSGELMASDKRRERIEKEREFDTQQHVIASAKAAVAQSESRLTQIRAEYDRQLHRERQEVLSALDRLTEERAKLAHRRSLLELRSPADGIVQDLSTHTPGTVVQPGTVLATVVPRDETLKAEVWVDNDDIGFVRKGQAVKIKLAPFPFNKYGMLAGQVERVSADAADSTSGNSPQGTARDSATSNPPAYKVLVALDSQHLEMNSTRFDAGVGMLATAEIRLGDRTVAEYLLSPVRNAWHDAARER